MQEKHERGVRGDGKQGKSAGKETGGMTAKRRPKARLCLVYLRLSVRPFVRLSVSVSLLPDLMRSVGFDTTHTQTALSEGSRHAGDVYVAIRGTRSTETC